jgi:hypothetical protein
MIDDSGKQCARIRKNLIPFDLDRLTHPELVEGHFKNDALGACDHP